MLTIDPEAAVAIRPHLAAEERILWAGRPSRSVIFRSRDALLIPFSLAAGLFIFAWLSIVAQMGANPFTRPPAIFLVAGIAFFGVVQYLIWGRFLTASWQKKRTFYAVTNRRVISVQDWPFHKSASAWLAKLPGISREGGGHIGTLRFGNEECSFFSDGMWYRGRRDAWNPMYVGTIPVFVDIESVDEVQDLINSLASDRVD